MLDVSHASVQKYRRDGIVPSEQRRRVPVPHDDIRLGADRDDAEIVPPKRQPTVAYREEEGLHDGLRTVQGDLASFEHGRGQKLTDRLQLEARLGENIAKEGEVGIDTEGGLVLDPVGTRAGVAVSSFGLRRYRDILVVLPEKGGALLGKRRGVREDY